MNYKILLDSIEHFKEKDYKEILVPWYVDRKYIEYTFENVDDYKFKILDNKYLVGSAEQSFIKLMVEDNIYGSYQALTPCFRDDIEDEIHHKSFMKNEIFINDDTSMDRLQELIYNILEFYYKYTNECNIEVVETFDKLSLKSFDININGIEVGSYGIREMKGYKWIYGTVLAEPRFSYSLEK